MLLVAGCQSSGSGEKVIFYSDGKVYVADINTGHTRELFTTAYRASLIRQGKYYSEASELSLYNYKTRKLYNILEAKNESVGDFRLSSDQKAWSQ